MDGCAKILFLPFVLCHGKDVDAGDQTEVQRVTQTSGANHESVQQPSALTHDAPPTSQQSTAVADLDDPLVSAILLHIALSDDQEGFVHLLRMKASTRALPL